MRDLSIRRLSGLVVASLLAGCALTSKGEPLTPRYFSPTRGAEPSGVERESAGKAPELRLGRVEAAAYLGERIAYRISDTELAYHDDQRWTESPEQFVRRALESQLFEQGTFRRVLSGAAPTLDVELREFEALQQGQPRARLALAFSLRDERHELFERTLVVDEPLAAGEDPGPALASAMAQALADACSQVAERVAVALRQRASERSVAAQGADGAGARDGLD